MIPSERGYQKRLLNEEYEDIENGDKVPDIQLQALPVAVDDIN